MSHLGSLMAGRGPRSPYSWTCCVSVPQDVFPLVRNSRLSHPVREGVTLHVLGAWTGRRCCRRLWGLLMPSVVEMIRPATVPRLRHSLRLPNLCPTSVEARIKVLKKKYIILSVSNNSECPKEEHQVLNSKHKLINEKNIKFFISKHKFSNIR